MEAASKLKAKWVASGNRSELSCGRGGRRRAIAAAAPDVVATGNPGCLMQIGAGVLLAGLELELRHPVELLELAYGG